jgi:CRP-like cAMP-binding protein
MVREILMEPHDEAMNPTLSSAQRALLAGQGRELVLTDGEVVYHAGDPYQHFYVVLAGEILIVDGEPGEEGARILAEMGHGKFLGEYGVLVGGLGLMTNVARGATRLA